MSNLQTPKSKTGTNPSPSRINPSTDALRTASIVCPNTIRNRISFQLQALVLLVAFLRMVGYVIYRHFRQFAGESADTLAHGRGDSITDVVYLAHVLVDVADFLGFLTGIEDVVPAAVANGDGLDVWTVC